VKKLAMAGALLVLKSWKKKMEKVTAITIGFQNAAPGLDETVFSRWRNWITEAYHPMSIKMAGIMGIDRFEIVRKSPHYPAMGAIYRLENIATIDIVSGNPDRQAIEADMVYWTKRGVSEMIWRAGFNLIQRFGSFEVTPGWKKNTNLENGPIMHLEAYKMKPEEQEIFNKWFNEYGGPVFIPLFMKTCGLRGYEYCQFMTMLTDPLETDYPPVLSLFYFDSIGAFETYENSPELVGYQRALRNVLPRGLNYRWYVQYRLMKSLRK
jgi:hypothetical protein